MEYEELSTELIKKTLRKFYEPESIVIFDFLLKELVLFDYDISERLKMLPKEFNKAIVKLKEDRLVCSESKIDNSETNSNISSGIGTKGFIRTVYYLDFCRIKDVIKYKIFKMSKRFEESTIKCTDDAMLYVCKACKREFNLYEIQGLMDENYKFRCDECMGDLEENKVTASNEELLLHKKMMDEVSDIIGILKKLDKFDIPNVDYFQVVKLREEKEKREKINKEMKEKEKINKEKEKNVDIFVDDENIKTEAEVIFFDDDTKEKLEKKEIKKPINITEMVKIGGIEKPYHEITESDKDKMNEEEYEAYYDIYMKFNDNQM